MTSGFKKVKPVSDPHEAADFFKKGKTVDIALIDITMPGMNGIELGRKIMTLYPDLKLLCVSGYSERAHELDQRQFLSKPFKLPVLAEKIDALLPA